jgi:hypothetical protein
VILAGSSNFFSRVLKQQQHPHPLIYMRGVPASQLDAVVDFIYNGEVNIYQEDLDGFLNLAEELQLKGLNETEQSKEQPQYIQSQVTKLRSTPTSRHQPKAKADLAETLKHEKNTHETSVVPTDSYMVKTQANYEELDATINSMTEKNLDGKWTCKVCGKIDNKDKTHMRNHIEGKHIEGVTHPCSYCGKPFRSRHSLACHISQNHSSS